MIQANNPNYEQTLNQISELITKNNSGIIVLPVNPTVDAIAAGTALYLGLTKLGKNVTVVCSVAPQSDLIGADKIQTNLATGGDNLVISFPYTEGSIDKVDYNIQGTTFNLVIAPRQGFAKLEPKQVQFSYTGGKIEFIITVDAPNFNSLGPIYQQNQNQFQGKNVINIDRHLINNSFGLINYVNKTSSSTSELVLKVLQALRCEIDKDIATNIYAGLVTATNGFTSYSVNADTFEAAANLLKMGAIKKPMNRPGAPGARPGVPQNAGAFNQPPRDAFPRPNLNQFTPPQPMEQQQKAIEDVESDFDTDREGENPDPESWLKPKIFNDNGGLV